MWDAAMGLQEIDLGRKLTDVIAQQPTTVKPGMFGAIATSMAVDYYSAYSHFVGETSTKLLRWPGGTFAENGVMVADFRSSIAPGSVGSPAYDLSYPDLIHPGLLLDSRGQPTGRPGFSDILSLATINQASVSVIIPTERYSLNAEESYDIVMTFLTRLFLEGAYNGGILPPNIIVDIGNENYNPHAYGPVAVMMLAAIRDFRVANPGIDFEVGLQAMQSGPLTRQLISIISDTQYGPDYNNLLSEVDIIRVHSLNHSLSSIAGIEDNSQVYWSILRLQEAVEASYVSAGRSGERPDVYFSAFTTNSNDVEVGMVSGLPAASAMLSLFTSMLELGADNAAAWGIAASSPAPTSMSYRTESGEHALSPSGMLYGLMARNLIGTELVSTETIDAGRAVPYATYAFSNAERSVLYVTANALDRSALRVSIDLINAPSIRDFSITVISGSSGISGVAELSTRRGVLEGSRISFDLSNDYEIVQIVLSHTQFLADGQIQRPPLPEVVPSPPSEIVGAVIGTPLDDTIVATLDASYFSGGRGFDLLDFSYLEPGVDLDIQRGIATVGQTEVKFEGFERFIMSNSGNSVKGSASRDEIFGGTGVDIISGLGGNDRIDGNGGDDIVRGGRGNDVIYGGSGNDILFGGADSDALYGEAGNDSLYGGAQNDTLVGGGGSDFLVGGLGADTFVFRRSFGSDIIDDFKRGDGDKIDLSRLDMLIPRGFSDILAAAKISGSSVVLDFAPNHSIQLNDFRISELHVDMFIL
jgi:hypothetical protein